MKIAEVRNILKENNFLYDKSIDIDSLVSGTKYEFICSQGHIFNALPTNAVKNKEKICCPVCSGRTVLKGVNDMWTTSPEIAKYLANPEDGYLYSQSSNVVLEWECPDCKHRFTKSPNKMSSAKTKCIYCSSDRSYSEKFVTNFLEQCCVGFVCEKIFGWSKNKRYDFYIPEFNCIIEVNGKQHYNGSFEYIGGKSLSAEQYNDIIKREMAIEKGKISHYITLNCEQSTLEWIKKSILESDIPNVLMISSTDIDWDECNNFATSNITQLVCNEYNLGTTKIEDLCNIFHLSKGSIRDKLNAGTKLGWCNYSAKDAIKSAHEKSGKWVVKTMSKPVIQYDVYGNMISEFSSIQEAQRQLGITHIWDCIVGRRKTAGGYIWYYKED